MLDRHRPPQPGDEITSELIGDLLQGAKQAQGIKGESSIEGVGVTSLHDGIIIQRTPPPLYAGDARKMCDNTFVAQIQPRGPVIAGTTPPVYHEDFTDSRYWVREVWEKSEFQAGAKERPAWLLDVHHAQAAMAPEELPENAPSPWPYYPVRYVVATNLAEVLTDDPGNESHALAVTEVEPEEPPEPDQPVPSINHGGALVHVFAVSSTEGPPRYFFSKSAAGGAIDWGVVRHVPDELEPFVEVTPVEVLDKSPWAVLPADVSKTYRTEPGTLGLHYKQWVWTGAAGEGFPNKPVTIDMVVLPLATHGSERIVLHHSRLWYPVPLPPTIIHTDCYLTAGGGQLELLGYGGDG